MNVAHLTTVHGRDDTRIFHKMCRSLVTAGHSITLYVADGKGDETRHGVEIIDIGKAGNRLKRASLLSSRMWSQAIRRRHDLYHFHDPELIAGGLVAKRLGRCVIYDIHEYYRLHFHQTAGLPPGLSRLLASLYGLAERLASAWLDACIVVVPQMLKTLHPKEAAVVANYVRSDEFQPASIPSSQRPRLITYVGVLSKERCIASMVDAAFLAGCDLKLAGRWYPEDYRDQIASRPGWPLAHACGHLDRRQIQALFEQSRAGLLIIDLQGDEEHASNNKLFEYMAAGLPVIASDLKFTREVINRHQCGLLISPPSNTHAIASAITWILEHPEEATRMGQAGRRAIEREYEWSQAEATLLALYSKLEAGQAANGRKVLPQHRTDTL